jgi:ectoine hydroxylase-related dioxygenase (phytanoyl-CoA dioxygenase family)
LPFDNLFADEDIFADPDVLAIVEQLVGQDFTMVQLASDTPLRGSDYQEIHRDAPPLFPELDYETPPFQLAVNFPLVSVTQENGPFEVARATHLLTKQQGLQKIADGTTGIEPILLQLGDVMIRDVRGLHRGTPNKTDVPRPMCVIGYSRKWLFRPEVSINIPRAVWEKLSPESQKMLRFNRVVETLEDVEKEEIYQSFAY